MYAALTAALIAAAVIAWGLIGWPAGLACLAGAVAASTKSEIDADELAGIVGLLGLLGMIVALFFGAGPIRVWGY